MFDILFGWRKASKCKKLIRRVQCRLKLLKNKRCSIVRQLREDVGQLLKHGHDQSAFDRVEQLIKDENIVSVYDLLDHFCEFIIIHLSYIRKHKDCPNDINEAVSTLIFASARCGDLPELPLIRKLFGERYGQRFATVALELLPGNLVNRQIKENLSIKSVPNDVKYRLVDEIARSCLQQGPLSLEYYPQVQQEEISKNKGDQFLSSVVQTKCDTIEESKLDTFEVMETEGKIVNVDFASHEKKLQTQVTQPFHLNQGSESTDTLTLSSTVIQSSPDSVYTHLNTTCEFIKPSQCTAITLSSSGTHNLPLDPKESDIDAETSSEISSQLAKEMIYLDDIEEFKSPMSTDNNCQDQRLFVFKSSVIPSTDKLEDGFSEGYSRSTRKSRNTSGKRQRRRSVSREGRSMKDVESTIYYDECKSHQQRKHQKKIPLDESQKSRCAQARLDQPCQVHTINSFRSGDHGRVVHECSLEHPCYICHCHCFCAGNLNKRELEWDILHGEPRREYPIGDKLASPQPRKVTPPPYLRVMTMPPKRPSDCHAENILRSNSFPFQQHGSSDCRHVHPKLPDYDQLAAKFMALKKENLQQKS